MVVRFERKFCEGQGGRVEELVSGTDKKPKLVIHLKQTCIYGSDTEIFLSTTIKYCSPFH